MTKSTFHCAVLICASILLFTACMSEEPPPDPAVAALSSFLVLPGDTEASLSWDFADGESPTGIHVYWGTDPEAMTETEFVPSDRNETEITGLTNGENYGFAVEVEGESGARSVRSAVQFVRPSSPDTDAPTIVATTPMDDATAIDTQSLLSVTFSEPMDASSVVVGLTPSRVLNTIHWNADQTELVTGPATPWREGETYEAKITGTDMSGNPLAGLDVFSFTVGYERLAPQIAGYSPDAGLTRVPTNSRITVTFSEPMDPISTNRALRISPSVATSYANDERQETFTWTPRAPLEPDTTYTVTVGANARSAGGHVLGEDIVFDFTTMTGPDDTPPRISSFLPEDDAAGQERHFEIAIAFSEAMDHAWTQAALVIPSHPGLTGSYTWNAGGTVMRFVPDEDPEFGEVVSWQLLGQAKDLAGNEIGADTSASFTILRLETATIYSDSAIDGTVAIAETPTEYGTHVIQTDSASMSVGIINYTYYGPSVQRGFYSFDLSALPEDLTRIHHAAIKHVESGWHPSDCAALGTRYLESVPVGPALTLDDFSVPTMSFYFCTPEGDCAEQPFRTSAPCIERWLWLFGKPQWTSWVTPAVQNDWDERSARQYLSQWRLRLEMETTDPLRSRNYLASHWQVDPALRPHLIVEYLIP